MLERLPRLGTGSAAAWVVLLVVAFLVLYPLATLVYASFRTGSPFTATTWSLNGYRELFADPDTLKTAWTTLWLAVVRAAGAAGLGIFLAWVVHRTDTPGRAWFDKLLYFRFFVPGLPIILAWVLLAATRSGLINRFGTNILGLSGPIFDIFSYQGIILTGILGWSTFMYVFISPAFQRMDMTLEESSRMSGAGQFRTLFRITVPLLMPAILATTVMAFIRMVESFEAELFLGAPVGIWVFTTRIYRFLDHQPPLFAPAMAMAMALVVMTFLLIAVQWKILGSREYVTVTGRGYKPSPMRLGRLRWLVFSLVVVYLFVDLVLPLGALVFGTFMKIAGVYKAGYTLANWTNAFGNPLLLASLRNTLVLGFVGASLTVLISTFASYIILRTKFGGRRAIELVTWLPWAVPGVVMGLGFLWAYIVLPVPWVTLYGTIWLIMVALVAKGLPISTRITSSTIVQVHKELEESSRISGASWLATFWRIWVPLLRPGLIASWTLLFVMALRDLSTVIFLYTPASRTLSVVLFEYWSQGLIEIGLVYGVLQAALCMVVYGLAAAAGGRFGRVAA